MNVTILNRNGVRRTIEVSDSVDIGIEIDSVKIDTLLNEIVMWIECLADQCPSWTHDYKYLRYEQEVYEWDVRNRWHVAKRNNNNNIISNVRICRRDMLIRP